MSQSKVRTVIGLLGCLLAAQGFAAEPSSAPRQTEPTTGKVRLMTVRRETELRRFLPKVGDEDVQEILNDPRLILYTDQEMPDCYQIWDGQLPGVHSVSYNISANESEPYGNGNIEFPWGKAAGTHRAANVSTVRFVYLPKDENEKVLPVTWYRQTLPGDGQPAYAWIFPVGTVFGEVLTMKAPWGVSYTFEMRLRIRESGSWNVDVYRPFVTAEDLSQRIKELRPEWQKAPQLAKLVMHLDSPIAMQRHVLANHHPGRVIYQTMGIDNLPEAGDDALIAELLQTPFQSALGSTWRKSTNGIHTCAPTTAARFHIVPANYDAGFIEVDRISCLRCHETTNRHVREFQAGRDWYGRVRGSDGIFSFHPFEPSSISGNGYGTTAPQMRAEFVRGGILERFNPSRHSPRFYNRVLRLR
jgi:hypothetical protein